MKFSRQQYIAVGKVIRNATITKESRKNITNALVKLFKDTVVVFDETTFRALCNCQIDDDYPRLKGSNQYEKKT